MFSHGTLLLDSDLDVVTAVLNVKPGKIESKGHKSVRSRVANISEFLPHPLTVEELRERIVERIFGTGEARPFLGLTDADLRAVGELVERKYDTWEWNYGESPPFNVQRAKRFPAGEIDLRIQVERGSIAGLKIYGDFMSRGDVGELETRLRGVRYEREELADVMTHLDVRNYFGGIENDDFFALLVD
jgi:lipoate-protein ligase A